MRKNLIIATIIMVCIFQSVYSQSDYKPSIDWHGFVKTDIFYDTRSSENLREGHFSILPLNEMLDADGNDLNGQPSFNILSIQTRLMGTIAGPEVYGIKTGGYIEAEFFGTSNTDVNGFRLRHAFVDMNWTNMQLRVGQFWHPMFITDCFPNVVSFNTGTPFQPFSRNPQIRLTYNKDGLGIIAAAMTQRDFASPGPGGTTSDFMRNAVIPESHLQVRYLTDNFLVGVSGDYKILKPYRTNPITKVLTESTIGSYSAQAYMKLNLKPITLKFSGVYGQNLSNLIMLGGYGISTIDTVTNDIGFTNQNIFSSWAEIEYILSDEIKIALFGGFSKNLGTDENLLRIYDAGQVSYSYSYWGRGTDIDNIIRVTPYIRWRLGKVELAGELEYTSAAYADKIDYEDKTKILESHSVSNIRALLAVYIHF
jgi:hypothetical protein